jgi:hypothetical protein
MPAVNYLAILVSAVAVFAIGMVWYSPALFARQWMAANGHTAETMNAMKPRMAKIYGLSFVCYLVMGFVMAILARRLGIEYWTGGVKLGGAAWLGFAATLGLTANLFSEKPLAAWLIDAGYQLVFMVAMGVIIAVWR